MNKFLLILFFVLTASALSAQQIYNGNFELWYSPYNPDGWGTWATAVAPSNNTFGDSLGRLCRKDSLDHANYPNDTNSVRLMVDTIHYPDGNLHTLAGFISLGGAFYASYPDTPVGLRFGYYPYSAHPDSLIFDYKYIVPGGASDTAVVVMTMIRFDSVIQAEVPYIYESWLLGPVSSWTHVVLKLDYLNIPQGDTMLSGDSIQIYILSSVFQDHRGTTLWLDTIHFDASVDILDSVLGIGDIQNLKGVKAYPNPANEQLQVLVQQSEIGSGIELFDAAGRQVYSGRVEDASNMIDTHCLPDGLYELRVNSRDKLTIYTGHISIVHTE